MNPKDYTRNRPDSTPRTVSMIPRFHRLAEGSVLAHVEGTVVLATASVSDDVPDFMRGSGKGWATAEYQMHPRSNPVKREKRDGRGKPISGRSQEIQRLIGRSLRAALDLDQLGEKTITVDCDILEADGGTRTASITSGWVAMVLALDHLRTNGRLTKPVLRDQVAAISVGLVDEKFLLDLCYAEDSRARVDLNLVATANHDIVEVQGTAEGVPIARDQLDRLIDLGFLGIDALAVQQRRVLEDAGVCLDSLWTTKGTEA